MDYTLKLSDANYSETTYEHTQGMVYNRSIVLHGTERNKMSEETTAPQTGPDPSTILCRVVDVNQAIQNSFQRFMDAEAKSLEDLALLLREEMSQIELFAPATDTPPTVV